MRRMTENIAPTNAAAAKRSVPVWVDRLTPRAGTRVQLFSAAIVWLVGASILLVRGVLFLHDKWFIPIVVVALVIGFTKER